MVYLFLADGFEEIEALTPVDLLRRAGVSVETVGVTGKTVTGSHKIKVEADVTLDEALRDLSDSSVELEMIVLPGGMPGAKNLDESEGVGAFIKEALSRDAYLAAICAAPMIYGKRGLLDGRDATCYPGFENYLAGAKLSESKAVKCGNIITATGAGAANEFAFLLISALFGTEKADGISRSVRFII